MGSHRRQRGLVLLALFLSGLAGLMHEVVWAKLLANLTGSTAKSHAVVLSVFMGGLAIGAVLFGRRSDKRENPLRVYVLLEIGIGVYCLVLPWITRGAGAVYESLAAATFEQAGLKLVLRLFLSLAVVMLPAVMMGGTLPVLARYLIQNVAQTRKAVASLYALNNIGAVLGSGAAGFVLLPALGIFGALGVASTLNFLAAAIVALASKRTERSTETAAAVDEPLTASYTPSQFKATLWALALSGFAAMGYEIVFLRIIALGFGSSTYSFTVMLMCFITGIGIGSWIVSVVKIQRPLWWLATSQLAVIVSLVAVTGLVERMPWFISSTRTALLEWPANIADFNQAQLPIGEANGGFFAFLTVQAVYCFAMLLLPTVCIGFGFPLVSQIQARSVASIGGTIGNTYAWNTIGNVLGVVITSLVLMPNLGIEGSLHANLALNAVAAALLLAAATEAALAPRMLAAAGTALALVIYGVTSLGWTRTIKQSEGHLRLRKPLPPDADALMIARHPVSSFEWWKKKYMRDPDPKGDGWGKFYLAEDADTNVMGVQRERLAAIYINSKGDASTGPLDMITFLLSGHIPMFFLPDPKDIMVVGHGSGVTAGAIAQHPSVERIDVVEISKAVMGADYLFEESNHHVLADPRTHVYLDDARTFLRTVPRKYDMIVSQPSNPWIAGIGSLFTVDFFRDCRDRLKPGGIMMVWFHHYEQSNETIQLIVRTINEVFPHVESFLTVESDVIGLATMEPLPIDFARMEDRFDLPEIRKDLARVGVYNLATMLAYHGVVPEHFRKLSGVGPLNTDDHQRLEYLGARNMFKGINADLLATDPGFDVQPDGTTNSLLDRYIAWRAAQGEPMHKVEMAIATASVENILTREHRLAEKLHERMNATPDDGNQSSQRPARGGRAPVDQMGFSEAFNWSQYVQVLEGPEAALPFMKRATQVEPTNTDACMKLSNLYMTMGRSVEASAELQRLATLEHLDQRLDPANHEGYIRTDPVLALARFAIQAQRIDDAKAGLGDLVRYEENGVALMLLGELTGADAQAAAANANSAAARGDQAAAAESARRSNELLDQAASYFHRAIVRDAHMTLWQATMNYSQILRQKAHAPDVDATRRRELLQEALSEVKYALFHNPGVADLQGQLAALQTELDQAAAVGPIFVPPAPPHDHSTHPPGEQEPATTTPVPPGEPTKPGG